jgi:uncharacterized protein HemX
VRGDSREGEVLESRQIMTLSTKVLVYVLAALVVAVVVGVGFKMWLEDHDVHLRTEYELRDLRLANMRLVLDRKNIQQETKAKDDEIHAERVAADTPEKQMAYFTEETAIHLAPSAPIRKPNGDLEAPKVEFAQSDLSKLDDVLAQKKTLANDFDGCRKEVANLEGQVLNGQQQISLLQTEKNGTKRDKAKWFLRGAAIAISLAKIAGAL